MRILQKRALFKLNKAACSGTYINIYNIPSPIHTGLNVAKQSDRGSFGVYFL